MQNYPDNERLIAVSESIVGRVRTANEDCCRFEETVNGDLFVVCDGMGGHVGGAVASSIAVSCIVKYFSESTYEDIPSALKASLDFANKEILQHVAMEPSLKGMGTTACILLVRDGNAWIAHVGDSRIYLYTAADRVLHRITKDHSYVQSLVDAGELDDRAAENHHRKNVILKALGIREILTLDVDRSPVMPSRGDVFLLCSDGLSGMMDDDELESVLQADMTLAEKLETLINSANAEGKGKDNITAQLIRIVKSNVETSVFTDYNPAWRRAKFNLNIAAAASATPVRKKRTWIWILLICLAAVATAFFGTYSALSLKDKSEEKKMERTQADRLEIEEEISKKEKEKNELLNEINALKKEEEQINNDIKGPQLERLNKEISDKIKKKEASLAKCNGEITELYNKLTQLEPQKVAIPDKETKKITKEILKSFSKKMSAIKEKSSDEK